MLFLARLVFKIKVITKKGVHRTLTHVPSVLQEVDSRHVKICTHDTSYNEAAYNLYNPFHLWLTSFADDILRKNEGHTAVKINALVVQLRHKKVTTTFVFTFLVQMLRDIRFHLACIQLDS